MHKVRWVTSPLSAGHFDCCFLEALSVLHRHAALFHSSEILRPFCVLTTYPISVLFLFPAQLASVSLLAYFVVALILRILVYVRLNSKLTQTGHLKQLRF